MSTQTLGTVGPLTQTWLLEAAWAQATPRPQVAVGHPDWYGPSCSVVLRFQQGHRLSPRPWASVWSLLATWAMYRSYGRTMDIWQQQGFICYHGLRWQPDQPHQPTLSPSLPLHSASFSLPCLHHTFAHHNDSHLVARGRPRP